MSLTPLTDGRHGWPFGSPVGDVTRHGYVMEEFALQGTATSYRVRPGGRAPASGLWESEPAETAPYTTRILVIRPADPGRFNGVAIVNWQNVTAGFDIGAPFGREIWRGYAWVGVSAQEVGLHGYPGMTVGLVEWDPERYGELRHPGDAWSYDIFTQAGRLLRAPQNTLLGGLGPTTLIATGASQSAMRLASYINAVHQHARLYDGFYLTTHWGICPPLEELSLMDLFEPTKDALSPAMCAIRDDGGVPVLLLSTESEARYNLPVRQPDSETFRCWEIAGAAHQSRCRAQALLDITARDGLSIEGAADPTRNSLEWGYVDDAALRGLVNWIRDRRTPASVPRIAMTDDPSAPIVRDDLGNALGGIRLPELEAPVAVYRGERGDLSQPDRILGSTTPLSHGQRADLYPDEGARTAEWNRAVDRLVAAGLVLPEDEPAVRARATGWT